MSTEIRSLNTQMKNAKRTKTIQTILALCAAASFAFVLVYFVFGCIISPKTNFVDNTVYEYEEEWFWQNKDGDLESFVAPYKLNSPPTDPVTVYTVLPDSIRDGEYMSIMTGRDFTAYIDGVKIYDFDLSKRLYRGFVVKSICVPIPLYNDYAGKTLTIVRNDTSDDNTNINRVYIGTMSGLVGNMIARAGIQFAMAIILGILAIITIVVFLIISYMQKHILPLVYMGVGILICSAWVITDSLLFQFAFHKLFIDGLASYMLTILIPIPFCLYLDRIQHRRYEKIYNAIEALSLACFAAFNVLHFMGIMGFNDALIYIDICIVISCTTIVALLVKSVWHDKDHEYKYLVIGMTGLAVFAIIEIIVINVQMKVNLMNDQTGIFLLWGLYVLLCTSVIDQIVRLDKITRESREALAATEAKSEFLANMSHEIRTPINAIMGMNEMILRDSTDTEILGYARDIQTASGTLLDIINDILDFSKIEAGRMEVIEAEYNLADLIDKVCSMVEIRAKGKNLDFKLDVAENLPSVLLGDEKRISEVMLNMLNNAVKYTDKGMVLFHVDGRYDVHDRFLLEFYVKDTGIGIKPEDQNKLFKSFERLDYARNKNVEGTGLGLSIAAKLVDMMGGIINVESMYGIGSRFSVTIPQAVILAEPIGDIAKHKHSVDSVGSSNVGTYIAPTARILVVDDNSMNRSVITKLLKKTQIQVDTVASGEKMLELIKSEEYDLILLDHLMPVMDGIDTLRAAQKQEENRCVGKPVIVLTANAIVGARESYIAAGFTDYLSKPVNPGELEQMIKKYLPVNKVENIAIS